MASYESQLTKEKEEKKNLGTIRLSRCAAGKNMFEIPKILKQKLLNNSVHISWASPGIHPGNIISKM